MQPSSQQARDLPESERLAMVRRSLVRHYFTDDAYLASDTGQRDLANHLDGRLNGNRQEVIPWIESFRSLEGARVLEIGCGTGASTLALAERGAAITAVDIREDSIQVARDRCDAYGRRARFMTLNACDIGKMFDAGEFDLIVFYAALEHMTHDERRAAMRDSWEMLPPGAFWVIVDTPNRLWYFDAHTALLPFFNWLPDQVAFEYSRFSPRENFRELYIEMTPEKQLHFLRRGRGISYHEFDLFIAPTQEIDVISCLHTYLRCQNPQDTNRTKSDKAAYMEFLHRACSGLHRAFLEPSLDLALRKR